MDLSPKLVANIRSIYGKEGERWLGELPARIARLSDLWDFRFLSAFENLTFCYVALVETASGAAVLKMGAPAASIHKEALWLDAYPACAPKVISLSDEHNAFLMERLEPGVPISSYVKRGDDEAATRILAQLMQRLRFSSPVVSGVTEFKHLSELRGDLPALSPHVDRKTLSKAMSLFHQLTADRAEDVLLHGDLHHDNVLQDADVWRAIDPHGYVGHPAAEIGAMMRNPVGAFPLDRPLREVLDRRLRVLDEELPYGLPLIRAWSFCISALSASWSALDFGAVTTAEKELLAALEP